MTTGDQTPPDFDFDSIIHGSGMVDPGMRQHMDTIDVCANVLNSEGGTHSHNYETALHAVNNEWPQHGVSATISGRVYLFGNVIDADAMQHAVKEWGEPIRLEESVYWDVLDAKLVSRGVVDDGDEGTVRFVCAFSFEDDEVPSFIIHRDESSVMYDRLTREGSEAYLRREWNDMVGVIDELLPEGIQISDKTLKVLKAIVQEFQDELYGYDELCIALSEYVTYRLDFNQTAAYAMVLKGDADFQDEDANTHPITIAEDTLEFVYRPVVVFSNDGDAVDIRFVVSMGDGSDDETILMTPIDTIKDFQPTFTNHSLLDRVGRVGNYKITDTNIEIRESNISPRTQRLDDLRRVQMALNDIIYQCRDLTKQHCETIEDALELSQAALYSIKKMAEASGIGDYSLRIEGEGIGVPPTTYDFTGVMSEGLTVKSVGVMGFMEPGDHRVGYFEALHASYTINDEDMNRITPTIAMQLRVSTHTEEVAQINEVTVNTLTIDSFVAVPLDPSTTIVLEDLDTEEIIETSLQHLQAEGENDIVHLLEEVYEQLLEGDSMVGAATIAALHRLAEYCEKINDDTLRKAVVAVLEGIFNDRPFAINTTSDTNELVAGEIVDVRFEYSAEFPPHGLVFTLAGRDQSLHTVATSSLQVMVPGEYQ